MFDANDIECKSTRLGKRRWQSAGYIVLEVVKEGREDRKQVNTRKRCMRGDGGRKERKNYYKHWSTKLRKWACDYHMMFGVWTNYLCIWPLWTHYHRISLLSSVVRRTLYHGLLLYHYQGCFDWHHSGVCCIFLDLLFTWLDFHRWRLEWTLLA